MTLPHFSVRDIEQTLKPTGYIIVVTTDVTCHLFMRWTIEKPRTHLDPETRRGVTFPSHVRFCFVEYEDNEQKEAGDTLKHTFIKLDWPVCQTRYFYFHGWRGGMPSPSETAILSKHFMGWELKLLFREPWGYILPPPPWGVLLFREPWTKWPPAPPMLIRLFTEPWTYYTPPLGLLFREEWTGETPPYPRLIRLFTEPWTYYTPPLGLLFREDWSEE